MTDISESGIEAALGAAIAKTLREYRLSNMVFDGTDDPYCLVDLVSDDKTTIASGERELELLADELFVAVRAAIEAHPPASREEGLREAAKVARETNGAHVTGELAEQITKDDPEREFWRGYAASKEDIAAAILALIPTKPEAKEGEVYPRMVASQTVTEPHFAEVLSRDRSELYARPDDAALQSKKPE